MPSNFPIFRTPTTRSSRTSTPRRCGSTTTCTTRRTSTTRTPRSPAPTWADKPVEQVLDALEILPEDKQTAVRNNAGGHANHSLFWTIMSPDGGGEPTGDLAAAIDDAFGVVRRAEVGDQRRRRQALRQRLDVARLGRHRPRRSTRRRTRTRRSCRATCRCSASTSGSTPTTSSTRTSVPPTSRPGGTSSTGPRWTSVR